MGTFFTDFLNTDFESFEDFRELFIKYPFVILSSDYEKYSKNFPCPAEEFKTFINEIYSKEKSKLIRIQEQLDEILDYCIINPRKRKNDFSPLDRFLVLQSVHENFTLFKNNKMEMITFYKIVNEPLANKSEDEIYKLLANKDNKIKKYNVYIPLNIESLIYYILSNIIENKLQLKICKNCSNYFVTNNLNINYCNNVAPGFDKPCDKIGVATTFKNTVENDELIKKYYKLYFRKAMMARRNPDIIEYKKDFENFKKFGKNKIAQYREKNISIEEFKTWIDKKDK